MNERASIAAPVPRWVLSARTTGALGLAFALFVAAGLVGLVEQVRMNHAGIVALRTLQAIDGAQNVLIRLVDAEMGQRGYLLTGDDRYLEPCEEGTQAIPADPIERGIHAGDSFVLNPDGDFAELLREMVGWPKAAQPGS